MNFFCYNIRMFSNSATIQRILCGFFLLSLLGSFVFVYLHVQGMTNLNMPMFGCPLMDDTAVVCNMNPIEHIEAWQHMFTALPQIGLILLIALIVALAFSLHRLLPRFWLLPTVYRFKRITGGTPRYRIQNHLQELFSQGILNPKLF